MNTNERSPPALYPFSIANIHNTNITILKFFRDKYNFKLVTPKPTQQRKRHRIEVTCWKFYQHGRSDE